MRSETSSARLTGISNLGGHGAVKPGFADGFEPSLCRSPERLLTAQRGTCRAREASLIKAAVSDSIGRFDIITVFATRSSRRRPKGARCHG